LSDLVEIAQNLFKILTNYHVKAKLLKKIGVVLVFLNRIGCWNI